MVELNCAADLLKKRKPSYFTRRLTLLVREFILLNAPFIHYKHTFSMPQLSKLPTLQKPQTKHGDWDHFIRVRKVTKGGLVMKWFGEYKKDFIYKSREILYREILLQIAPEH